MRSQGSARGPGEVRCVACGSPHVVAMDEAGDPVCLRHHALALGGRDGEQSAALELVDLVLRHVVETGLLAGADASRAANDAIRDGLRRRAQAGMRPAQTFEETQEAIDALARFEGLSNREGGKD
jgi:hypothetical protein